MEGSDESSTNRSDEGLTDGLTNYLTFNGFRLSLSKHGNRCGYPKHLN